MIGSALRVAIGAGYEPYGPPPSGLGTTINDWDDIQLDWADNTSDEDGFIVERQAGEGSWSELDTVGADVTTYQDVNITHDVEYTYRVRAYLGSRKSARSAEATFAVPSTISILMLNMQTGWQRTDYHMIVKTIREALNRILAYWEYPENEWEDWTCGAFPGSPFGNLGLTLADAGISDGSTLYCWLA